MISIQTVIAWIFLLTMYPIFPQSLTMTKTQFIPQTDENRYLNTTHKCNLTGSELSTILYILEGYINPTNDNSYDPDCREDIDRIFVELQSVTDNYYAQLEEAN